MPCRKVAERAVTPIMKVGEDQRFRSHPISLRLESISLPMSPRPRAWKTTIRKMSRSPQAQSAPQAGTILESIDDLQRGVEQASEYPCHPISNVGSLPSREDLTQRRAGRASQVLINANRTISALAS